MAATSTKGLCSLIMVDPLKLLSRVVMAPPAQNQSEQSGEIPGETMSTWYAGLSSGGGLIVSQPAAASIDGGGCIGTSGICTEAPNIGWRKVIEILEEVSCVWGRARVGLRLSPSEGRVPLPDPDPDSTFDYVAGRSEQFGMAYIHLAEPRVEGDDTVRTRSHRLAAVRLPEHVKGTILVAEVGEGDGSETIIERGEADPVTLDHRHSGNLGMSIHAEF